MSRADLRNLLGGRAEPIQPRHQRGVQRGRHWAPAAPARESAGSGAAALQHRLGQLLDEQRHPVRALDDLRDDIARQRFGADDPPDQRGALAPVEPIEDKRP